MNSARTEIALAIIVGSDPRNLCRLPEFAPQQTARAIFAASPYTLRASLNTAKILNYTHAYMLAEGAICTADDFAALLSAAEQNPFAIVLGYPTSTPPCGLFARISDLLIRLETGLRLRDPRGPRIYPLRLLDAIPASRRKLTDMEILVRAVWIGCPIVEVSLPHSEPIGDEDRAGREYFATFNDEHIDGPSTPGQAQRRPGFSAISEAGSGAALRLTRRGGDWRGSDSPSMGMRAHQRAGKAFCTLLTHFRLLARALSGWPHRIYEGAAVLPPRASFWRNFLQWFNPLRAWRELRQGGATRGEIAAGLAAGVFIANTPAWGFHTVLSLHVARRWHLHPLAVVAGSHISAPPMGPFLVAAAMWLGHVILHGTRPLWNDVTPFQGKFALRAFPLLVDWMLGAAIIGTTLAFTVFIVANFLFRFLERGDGNDTCPTSKPRQVS